MVVSAATWSSRVSRTLNVNNLAPRCAACFTRNHQIGASSCRSLAKTMIASPAPNLARSVPAPTPTCAVTSPPAIRLSAKSMLLVPTVLRIMFWKANKSSLLMRSPLKPAAFEPASFNLSATTLKASSHDAACSSPFLRTIGVIKRSSASAK